MSTDESIYKPLARSGHIAVSIGGFVVVWGGYSLQDHLTEQYIEPSDVCVYEVESQLWRQILTEDEIPPGTSGACAVAVGHQMYVLFGHSMSGNSNETFCLDFPKRSWTYIPTGKLIHRPSPRDKLSAWHYDDKIYIFGGYGFPMNGFLHDNGCYVSDDTVDTHFRGWNNQLCALDLETHRWADVKTTGSLPSPRAAHATAASGDRVFLFGGRHKQHRLNDLYMLHMVSLQWTNLDLKGEVPCGRSWHTLSAFDDNYMFLYGGYSQANDTLCDCWVFDYDSCLWREMPNRNQHRLWHSACTVSSGEVAIFGGCKNNILNHDINVDHSNDVLLFRFTPESLLRIALEWIVKNHKVLSSEFCELPRNLQEVVSSRVERVILSKKVNSNPTLSLGERGQTCDVS